MVTEGNTTGLEGPNPMERKYKDCFEDYRPYLEEEMVVQSTGRSVAVRLYAPKLTVGEDPEEQEEELIEGLNAAKRLHVWTEENIL